MPVHSYYHSATAGRMDMSQQALMGSRPSRNYSELASASVSMGLSAAASISLTQARPHMGTACPQDEHSSLTSSSGTLKGSFGGDRFAIPQNAVTSQHVAYEAVSKMSTLQSDSSTASTGSVNQNIEDKDHQKDDVEMFDGKDHVMFIDGQRSERGGFQRNTGQAQLAQCVQKRKPSPQAGFSFSAILTSPQKGSSNKNSDETQKLRNFEERPATPQSEGSIDTLDKYAFNFHRDAYDHQVPRHLITGVSVHVSKLAIKTSLDQHYHTAQEKGLADVCPPLVPHEHELQELDFNNIPCIWVGMCLSPQRRDQDNAARLQTSNDANGEGSSKKPSKKKAKLASIADLSEDDMRILPFDPNALRVVVKKGDKTTRCWPTYALLNPNQDNLCEGFTVPAEGVYFFKQFRDDKAKSFSARLGAMRAKVRTKMFPAGTPKEIGDVILDRMREEIARAKEASNTTAQDSVQKSLHGDERSPSTDTTLEELTVDFEGGPTFDELMADLESDGVGDLDLDCDEYGNTAYSGKGRDEEAYPEHAVAATDANYMEYENDLIGRFLQTNSKAALKGSGSRYSEKGQDNNNNDQGVIERDEGTQPISPSSLCSDGYAGADEQEPVSTVQPQAVGLARRMIEMVEELAAQGDVAALRQGCRMLDCLKTRSVPPRTGALGLYLNVPIDDTNDPSFSPPMLDELLELFPDLEDDARIDDHVLAWMSRALQLTGQSLDIELLRPCLVAFAEDFAARFGEDARQVRVSQEVLVDMICQARDEAEEMLKVEIFGAGGQGEMSGGTRSSSHHAEREEVEETRRSWRPHIWGSPDQAGGLEEEVEL